MKKVLMILLAFSLVFGLALMACGNSSGIADLSAEVEAMRKWAPPVEPTDPDVVKTITIPKNEYGKYADGTDASGDATNGFQLQLKGTAAPFTTAATGDVYKLTIAFKTSRDVAEPLFVGIADTDSSVSYWKPLSWTGNNMPKIFETATAGELIEKEITFQALSDDSTSLGSCALAFQTEMEAHTLGDLILSCTVYEFTKQ
jgi:hypothetical protein